MRKAVINTATGLVENIIVADDDFDPGPGKELQDPTDAEIGGTWNGSKYIPKPQEPPRRRYEAAALAIENAPDWPTAKTALSSWIRAL